jgi:hypothetical protein
MTDKGLDQKSLDATAVERILAAVGEKFVPAYLDKLTLAKDIATCFTVYCSAVQRRSDKPTKDRIRRLNSIQKAAKRFERQLAPDDIWGWKFFEARARRMTGHSFIGRMPQRGQRPCRVACRRQP